MNYLLEDSRSQLINRSKNADNYVDQSKGKNRYQRRVHSRVANSVAEFNKINMNELFKNNILTVTVNVTGETDNYQVIIKFGNFLGEVHNQLNNLNSERISLRIIIRSLVSAFNSEDVYIHCLCPDWKYRFSYWSRVNGISSDINNEQTDNGKEIRNPHDTKGAGCKHTLLVLANNSWLTKVASVIYNYINYMEKHYQKLYADIIYPAIYEKEYSDDVQLSIDDLNNGEKELKDDSDEIDISNKYARTKNQFKAGNQSGIQFASKNDEPVQVQGQKKFNFDSLMSD